MSYPGILGTRVLPQAAEDNWIFRRTDLKISGYLFEKERILMSWRDTVRSGCIFKVLNREVDSKDTAEEYWRKSKASASLPPAITSYDTVGKWGHGVV